MNAINEKEARPLFGVFVIGGFAIHRSGPAPIVLSGYSSAFAIANPCRSRLGPRGTEPGPPPLLVDAQTWDLQTCPCRLYFSPALESARARVAAQPKHLSFNKRWLRPIRL